ncbi:MAG: hypothetical protein H7Y30_11955 [Pyrinomonadaceae bacterium]|nr:hypothetical protein [Pyrinomonadaceae bacterium]
MRFIVSCAATLVLAIALLAACNSNDFVPKKPSVTTADNSNAPQKGQPDGVRRITITELKAEVDKGNVVLVDTRPPEAYALEHAKGAIHMTEAEVEKRSGELPRDKMIVAYCS